MFLRNQFEGTDVFDIPLIRKQNIDLNDVQFIGYDKTTPNDSAHKNRFVHFFLDDYKFEVMWNDPEPRLEKLRQYKGVLSPQYSTYYTMPIALQLYNTFRSRWCGAYLQQRGITVIPTVSWGLPQSYHFCFNGIEEGSVVAVSTVGVRTEKDFFLQGYNELQRRIKPSAVICYGKPYEEMQGKIITVDYAETNNLSTQEKLYQLKEDLSAYKFFSPPTPDPLSQYIITAGMGGGSIEVQLPKDESQLRHIFSYRQGHLMDTPENRKRLLHLARDTSKFVGKDKYGNHWHISMEPDGSQLWVRFQNSTINEGGLNPIPRVWDNHTGLNFNPFK